MTESEELAHVKQGIRWILADASLFILRRELDREDLEWWARETVSYLGKLINQKYQISTKVNRNRPNGQTLP